MLQCSTNATTQTPSEASQRSDASANGARTGDEANSGAGGTAGSEGESAGRNVDPSDVVALPDQPDGSASSEFWDHWGDGKAELSSYEGEMRRYGELRDAETVLIYVTEPHDRRDWIKENDAPEEHEVNVMKLNHVLTFQTGIYPYSIMTSVFSPVDDWGRARFQPAKIVLSSQEWCGNVWHGVWPGPDRFYSEIRSYFDSEGESSSIVEASEETLYQDGLLIQLRELDGEFNGGEDWKGKIVPSLWANRKAHTDLEPVSATIERKDAELDGTKVTRFVLEYGDTTITYDIEKADPHRVLRWKHSNGSHFRLQKTKRLPYWRLNNPGGKKHRKQIGLDEDAQ